MKMWKNTEVIQLLDKIRCKLLDWNNDKLNFSLAQRTEIEKIFEQYEDYYLRKEDKSPVE